MSLFSKTSRRLLAPLSVPLKLVALLILLSSPSAVSFQFSLKSATLAWRQISGQGVQFSLTTVWQYSTFLKLDGNRPSLGDYVPFLDTTPTNTDRLPIQFDFGDASTILTGQREVEAPYTPLCTSNLPPGVTDRCLWGTVRQIDEEQDTVLFTSIVEHDYQFGDGPYYARFTGCCRPDFPSGANNFQGLTNNPAGPWKIAADVLLSSSPFADPTAPSAGSFPQSPFFFFPPVLAIELAKPLDVPVIAYHPFDTVSYRIGTASDYAADLTSTIPADKQGAPPGVTVEAETGLLKLPSLNEQQLYAIHIVAVSSHGASSSIDFYVQVVDDKGNTPPLLEALRVPAVFVCEEPTDIILAATDLAPAATLSLSFSRTPLLPLNPATVAAPFQPSLSISAATSAGVTATFSWQSPCEALPDDTLYPHQGRHWLGVFGICFEAFEDALPAEHLVAIAPRLRSLPTCLPVPVIRCTTPTLSVEQLPPAEVTGTVVGGQWTVLVGTSAQFVLAGVDDSQTLNISLEWDGDATGVTVAARECTVGGEATSGAMIGPTVGCWGGRWAVTVTGSMENAGRQQTICYEAVNDQQLCGGSRQRSEPICITFIIPPPQILWLDPLPTEVSDSDGEDDGDAGVDPDSAFSLLKIAQSNHRPYGKNTLTITMVPQHTVPLHSNLTISGLRGLSTPSSPPFVAPTSPVEPVRLAQDSSQWVDGSLCASQSSRLPGALNRVQATMQPKHDLVEGFEIVITGLLGTRVVCGGPSVPVLDFGARLWTRAAAEGTLSVAASLSDLVSCGAGACVSSLLAMDMSRVDDVLGIRISGVAIPYGAQVLAASIELVTNSLRTDAATIRIVAQKHHNAAASAGNSLLSARARTNASVDWILPAGTIGERYTLPDLGPLVQEVVREEHWREGNAVLLLLSVVSSPCQTIQPTPTTGCQLTFLSDLATARPTLTLSHKCPVVSPRVDLETRVPGDKEIYRTQGLLEASWNQTDGTLLARLRPGQSVPMLHSARLSFNLHNGLLTQSAPQLSVQTGNATGLYCGTLELSRCESAPEPFSACDGLEPPLLLSAWKHASVAQDTSVPLESNRINLALTPALPLDESAALTLSGIVGILQLDEGSFREDWEFGVGSAVGFRPGVLSIRSWDAVSGTLVIGINAGRQLHAGYPYRVSFAVVNGGTVQDGGAMAIFAGGIVGGTPEALPTTGSADNAVSDSTALRVRLWERLSAYQVGGVVNATTDIILELRPRATVSGGASLTLSGLEGVATSSGAVSLEYVNTGEAATVDVFGPTGQWDAEKQQLSMETTAGLPMEAQRLYIVTFRLMAALIPQPAPMFKVALAGINLVAAPEVASSGECEERVLSLNSVLMVQGMTSAPATWRCVQYAQHPGTLVFQNAAPLVAGAEYVVSVAFTNGGETQPSQALFMEIARGGHEDQRQQFAAEGAEDAQPLRIKLWETKSAWQTTTDPAADNIVYLTLTPSVRLAAGSEITITGLQGTQLPSPDHTPLADCNPPPCLVVSPAFDPVLGRLWMVIKDGEALGAGETLSLAIAVRNAKLSQPAPSLMVEASGSVVSQRTSVVCASASACLPAGAEQLSTPPGELPPLLLSMWRTASVQQVSPVPSGVNELLFTMRPATDLAAGDVITFSGIAGTLTSSAPQPRLVCPDGTLASCTTVRDKPVIRNLLPAADGQGWTETAAGRIIVGGRTATDCGTGWQLQCALGEAVWTQDAGSLSLTVQGGDGGGLNAEVTYQFAMEIVNGLEPGQRDVQVAVAGSVTGEAVSMQQPPDVSDERVFVLTPLHIAIRAGCQVRQVLHVREGGGQLTLYLEALPAPHGLPAGSELSYECLAEGGVDTGDGIGGCVEIRRVFSWRPDRSRMGSSPLVCFEARTQVEGGVRRCLQVEVRRCAYCLQEGESFESLARELGTSWLQLWGANPHMRNPQDAALYEPVNLGALFQPLSSDTVESLALRFHSTLQALRAVNPDLAWEGAQGMQREPLVGQAPLPHPVCVVPLACGVASGE